MKQKPLHQYCGVTSLEGHHYKVLPGGLSLDRRKYKLSYNTKELNLFCVSLSTKLQFHIVVLILEFQNGGAGSSLPQFSNSPIWMFGKEYKFKPPDISLSSSSSSTTTTTTTTTTNNNNTINTSTDQIDPSPPPPPPSLPSINSSSENLPTQQQQTYINEFLLDFSSKVLWFSYRQGFPYIENTLYDNDCGWGCMLRSGQMLLSNILLQNTIGKDWKKLNSDSIYPDVFYDIVRLFLDKPTSPFSIHNIALEGQRLGKNIGEWFAPTIISQTIKQLVSKYYNNKSFCNLSVFISEDGSLYIDQLLKAATTKQKHVDKEKVAEEEGKEKEKVEGEEKEEEEINNKLNESFEILEKEEEDQPEHWDPLIILIPVRLGLDGLNQIYYSSLLDIFKIPQNLGIVGGKPRASLYFVASQDDSLFYLDPHTVQQSLNDVDSSPQQQQQQFPLNTFFCSIPKKAHVSEVDPSLVISFFCKTKEEFLDFVERCKEMISKQENPIFSISDNAPDYQHQNSISIEGEEEDSSDDIDFEMDYHL
eukprot:gene11613-14219_t